MNHSNKQILRVLGLTVALSSGLVAQRAIEPVQTGEFTRAVDVTRTASGITVDGESVWGLGPDYKAEFVDGGVEFTPALGRRAPKNFPIRFTLESIRRGATDLVEPAPGSHPKPIVGDSIVRYPRGDSIVETYRVAAAGIKQDFVFASKPAGTGDLVVRGQLATEMSARTDGDELVFLASEELGGVRIGAVTVIDATGRESSGTMRFEHGVLELTVPSATVEQATYPLTLDPWITGEFPVGSATARNVDPDVAFDETLDLYMAVWEREFSINGVDIRAATFDDTGATVTALIGVVSGGINLNPAIAGSDVANDFFIVYQKGPSVLGPFDIVGRNYDPGGPGFSAETSLAATGANEVNPDVGGDGTTADDRVIVVWEASGAGIRAMFVDQQGTAAPILGAVADVSTDPRDRNPAISKSGGSAGQWMVVFEREINSARTDIRAASLGRNATLLDTVHTVSSNSRHEREPDVDGDGTTFLVAWHIEESGGSFDHDVWGRSLQLSGSGSISNRSGIVQLGASNGMDERDPAVSFLGVKFAVAYAQQFASLNYDIRLLQLNADCMPCGPAELSSQGATIDLHPELASRYSGDASQNFVNSGSQDAAMLVLESGADALPFDLEIQGRLFEATGSGGSTTNLGGGCGLGGTTSVAGGLPAIGNAGFQVRLTGATGAIGGLLVIDLSPPIMGTVTCGPCTVLVGLATQPPTAFNGAAGTAQAPLPIPCASVLIGAAVQVQWLTVNVGSNPCPIVPAISASNRLRITIGD